MRGEKKLDDYFDEKMYFLFYPEAYFKYMQNLIVARFCHFELNLNVTFYEYFKTTENDK